MSTSITDILYGSNTRALVLKKAWLPSTGLYPTDTTEGLIYIAEDGGTIGLVTYVVGDSITYYNGSWIRFGSSGGGGGGTPSIPPLESVATTGVSVAFNVPMIYGTADAAESGAAITASLTNAKLGIVQKMYHNAGAEPTVPVGWVKLGTGSYVTNTVNIIYCEWVSGTRVEYWVTQ